MTDTPDDLVARLRERAVTNEAKHIHNALYSGRDAVLDRAAADRIEALESRQRALEAEARFLLDRLKEFGFDGDTKTDDGERDWRGNVAPSISRLNGILAALAGDAP